VNEVGGEERLEEHGGVAIADREKLGGQARGARAGELSGRESGEASAEIGLVGGANKAKLVLDEAVGLDENVDCTGVEARTELEEGVGGIEEASERDANNGALGQVTTGGAELKLRVGDLLKSVGVGAGGGGGGGREVREGGVEDGRHVGEPSHGKLFVALTKNAKNRQCTEHDDAAEKKLPIK
jgi:hypothetical protein